MEFERRPGSVSPSGGLGSAVGSLLVGVSILVGCLGWEMLVAEAGTCSGVKGLGQVEIGTIFQEGTKSGFLRLVGGPWPARSALSSHPTHSFSSSNRSSVPLPVSPLCFPGRSLHCEIQGT